LQEERVERCYAEFRAHCIERHGLDEADTEAQMFLDLDAGTLTMFKIVYRAVGGAAANSASLR
jgi:hypothetical protein